MRHHKQIMLSKHLLIFVTFALANQIRAQGYGDAPDPEQKTVTSAPIAIDCGPTGTPQTLPTLPPIQFATFPPAPRMPTFEEIFTTVAPSYPTAPEQKQGYDQAPPQLPTLPPAPRMPTFEEIFTTVAPKQQGYDQAPPQLPTLPPAPRIPTFNELFPPAPVAKSDPYVQPKIDYASVTPAATYPTPSPAFTFPPPMKIPTFAELFPPAPIPSAPKSVQGYDVGPPAAQPQEPYSPDDSNDDMDNDDMLLQPVEGESSPDENPKRTLNPEKARAKLEKLRVVHGVKTNIVLGSPHHVRMHNIHEHHIRH